MTIKFFGIWYADYSNSSVGEAVYSKEEEAEAVARESGGSVIEFEFDPPLSDAAKKLIRPGEHIYMAGMAADRSNGRALKIYPEDEPETCLFVRVDYKNVVQDLNLLTWAKDELHAMKILSEYRARWIANGSHVSKTIIKRDGVDQGLRKAE